MENLISAWGNYHFKGKDLKGVERYFKVTEFMGKALVYENIEDDINELVYEGTLEQCVEFVKSLGLVNYDPLAKYR